LELVHLDHQRASSSLSCRIWSRSSFPCALRSRASARLWRA